MKHWTETQSTTPSKATVENKYNKMKHWTETQSTTPSKATVENKIQQNETEQTIPKYKPQ